MTKGSSKKGGSEGSKGGARGSAGDSNGGKSPKLGATKLDWAGYLGGVLQILALLPFYVRVGLLGCASQMSWLWAALQITSAALWIAYGVVNRNMVLVSIYCVTAVAYMVGVGLKIAFLGCEQNLPEEERIFAI